MIRNLLFIGQSILLIIFSFYAGKYYCWEDNPQKYITSEGTRFKDWQVALILAIMTAISMFFTFNKRKKN